MPAKFTIEVNIDGCETRAAELERAEHGVVLAVRQARAAGGAQLDGVVTTGGHKPIATWKFSPGSPK